jgi:hypothetical protein
MSDSGDIIIRGGGSVEIVFSEHMFPGQDGRYRNQHKQIVTVEVRDDDTGQVHTIDIPASGKCTVRVTTR